MFKFHYQNGKKESSWRKFSGLQNEAIRGLQIGEGFRDCKSGQERLQIGAALGISNWGRDYKSEQERFQNGAGITNRYRTKGSLGVREHGYQDATPRFTHLITGNDCVQGGEIW